MFRFANPQYLYLISLIPFMWLLFVVASHNRRKRLAKFGNPEIMKLLMPNVSRGRVRFKFLLLLGSLFFLFLALARPQFGSKLREQKSRGVEMMLVVDVSNSMLVEDFEPNRLERTKYAISRLFEGMDQDRVGLVAFAGDAEVQLPITSDYRMAQAYTSRLSTSSISTQGTDIGRALDLALLSYSDRENTSRVMILITDGENHDQNAIAAAQRAKMQGVKIYTIGIGTPEGAPISIGGEFIKDSNGEIVVSKLGEDMLREISALTEGAYIRASNQSLGLTEITTEINKLEKGELSTVQFEEYNEQFQYMLAISLLLLLLEISILGYKNPALERFNIFKSKDVE
ncbi:MAG: VWA domain-containing protein [Rikenellaceae bacterium]